MKLDKFYTKPTIANKCIKQVNIRERDFDLIIEPSAGNGSFSKQIKSNHELLAMDIEPEDETIITQDFLTYMPQQNGFKKILVIGNPPFGRVSSMAVKFFNHSAQFADTIAMILPRTFRKTSVQNKLNLHFHLKQDTDIPTHPCAFEPPMMAKCCFQIWKRNETKRIKIVEETTHKDWEFLKMGPMDINKQPTPPTGADFAIRAYGGKCGEIKTTHLHTLRPKSWHWIKSNINIQELIKNLNKINYKSCENTARQNSIGKAELVQLYSNVLK